MSEQAKEVVLTGGPCAGKTTGKNYIAEKLRERGVRVFCAPEVATMFITGGVPDISSFRSNRPDVYLEIERQMLIAQMDLIRRFREFARVFPDQRKLILYDRGPMDIKAYLPEGYFEIFLRECGLTLRDARDQFHAVFHLVTAADGAEEFYTLENNTARYEMDFEAARQTDKATLTAWLGHPHLKIIDNSTDFKGKMKHLLTGVSRVMGMPAPLEIERKFLLARRPDFSRGPLRSARRISVEQMYLISPPGEERRIRRWSQGASAIYYMTHKKDLGNGVRRETEAEISATQYLELQSMRDPRAEIVRKNRYCFVWNYQYFELDVFLHPQKGLCLLEIELTEMNDKIDIPPFLEIEKEVTGNPLFSNYSIARGI